MNKNVKPGVKPAAKPAAKPVQKEDNAKKSPFQSKKK